MNTPRTHRRENDLKYWQQFASARMARSTSAFLTWGLQHPDHAPRLPLRPPTKPFTLERAGRFAAEEAARVLVL